MDMQLVAKKLVSFLKAEDGPTAVEYAVMLALIIVVCIAAITTLGTNANPTFSLVGSAIQPTAAS
jgi:pilus assembly protein Flp/PilA